MDLPIFDFFSISNDAVVQAKIKKVTYCDFEGDIQPESTFTVGSARKFKIHSFSEVTDSTNPAGSSETVYELTTTGGVNQWCGW